MMTPAQRATTDDARYRATMNGGALVDGYGAQQEEYEATLGALHAGFAGEAGRCYLRQNAPELLEVLRDATGYA